MKKLTIEGKVIFQSIETGFWSIVDKEGKMWRILEMQHDIQTVGKEVKAIVKEVDNEFSTYMNGIPAKLMGFTIKG